MHKKVACKRNKKRAELKALPKRKYYISKITQISEKVKEESELKTQTQLSFKLGVIICAFLYALSEMIAGHIHWAIGDLILVALWMGGKSVFADLRTCIEARKFLKRVEAEIKRKGAA